MKKVSIKYSMNTNFFHSEKREFSRLENNSPLGGRAGITRKTRGGDK